MRTRLVHTLVATTLLVPILLAPAHGASGRPAGLTERARTAAASSGVDALTLLRTLTVTKSAPSATGYRASRFAHWTDSDGDSCNTRAEVLLSDSRTTPKTTGACTVKSGTWRSAYDSKTLRSASAVKIDHLVGLKEAWRSGAKSWTSATRRAFANDLTYSASLVPVSKASKKAKGHKDPSAWMPAGKASRCTYAASWTAVKYRWKLTVDAKEKKKLTSVLTRCSKAQRTVAKPARATVKKVVTTSTRAKALEKYLHAYVNDERTARGLKPLKRWNKIDTVARTWSKKQAAAKKMRHNPKYTAQVDAIKRWRNVGENVAMNSRAAMTNADLKSLAKQTVEIWMKSKGHRKNILNAKYTHGGVGAWYSGSNGWFMTQNFARF